MSGGWGGCKCGAPATNIDTPFPLVAEVALARLVQEALAGVRGMAGHLLTGTVLALDAIAGQMAAIHAGLGALHTRHVAHFGQGAGLGSCTTCHPRGQVGPGGRERSRG